MTASVLAFLVTSSLYLGFQWTIRVVVYPQFALVTATDFPAYERNHQRLLVFAVGPLFLALGISALVLLFAPSGGSPLWLRLLACGLVASVLLVTAVGAVPLHRRLSAGFDLSVHRRLLRIDTLRLLAALSMTVVAIVLSV